MTDTIPVPRDLLARLEEAASVWARDLYRVDPDAPGARAAREDVRAARDLLSAPPAADPVRDAAPALLAAAPALLAAAEAALVVLDAVDDALVDSEHVTVKTYAAAKVARVRLRDALTAARP